MMMMKKLQGTGRASTLVLTLNSFWLEHGRNYYKSAFLYHDMARECYNGGDHYGGDCYAQRAWRWEEEGDARILLAYPIRLPQRYRQAVLHREHQQARRSHWERQIQFRLSEAEYDRKRGGKH